MSSSWVGGLGELTMSTATSGAVGGAVLDEPMGADLSLATPKGVGTMCRLQSRRSMPNNGLGNLLRLVRSLSTSWNAMAMSGPFAKCSRPS